MKCENVNIYLPEYIDEKLDTIKTEAIKSHLDTCKACQSLHKEMQSFLSFADNMPKVEPPADMKDEFMEMAEINVNPEKRVIYLPGWLKVAAVMVFAMLTYAGGYLTPKGDTNTAFLESELLKLKQDVIRAELQDVSGPQKIQAVYSAQQISNPGNQLLNALVQTMNTDKNVNVRLAAINALSGQLENQQVKDALIQSLTIQDNPLLQISLIQVLTESGIKEAKDKIESISNSDDTDPNVKTFARDMVKTII